MAAKPTPTPNAQEPRIRDLRTLTGETGLWISLDDLRAGEKEGRCGGWRETVEERVERLRDMVVGGGKREGKGKGKGWGVGGGEI